jgi:sigma-B regulation protein RsbU (phosphoserine phosphatase)
MEKVMSGPDKKTILLVDDTPANIQVANSILKDDYKIRIATNGVKALELTNGKPAPDLILLDVMMPEMDGYEVCARLKSNSETKDIPVIFLTGKTDVEDETRGFEVGAVDYIHKPFSPAVVKARVRTHLMLREARELLARQLTAINNELEMAREIQLSILPQVLPVIDGLDIIARYVPMSSVAGDFYDFIVPDGKHLGILIADVSGHGLPAALIASMLQVALTGQEAHAAHPERVLAGLNKALCGKFKLNFVTAAYVYVDLEKNVTHYAGAGHPPLLLWNRKSGKAADLCENGLPLGQFPEAEYKTIPVPAGPGDRIVLYTDGIMEARNATEEQYGVERIKGFMESQSALTGEQFADKLLDEVWQWSGLHAGESQGDDITLLSIQFKNPK